MSRVTAVYEPGDYPGEPGPELKQDLAEFFGQLFPGVAEPKIARDHAGLAIAAQNPKLALHLAQLSKFIALHTEWGRRADLRELAIQTANLHFKSGFSFQARLPNAKAAGISAGQLAAIPLWRTVDLFTDEQKLVIEYAQAVAAGDVPEALFARVVAAYGEKEAVEFTAAVAWWSFWAMLINATRPEL